MGKILTKAQKTFTDLYDSYVLNLSSDIVAVPCDQYGAASEDCTVKIAYSASVGTESVGSTCEIMSATPGGISYNIATPGIIHITVHQGTTLEDDSEIGFKFTTTNSNAFTFERYISFVKIKSGEKIVTFQIKSEKGDTFKEGIDEILLETVAFDGLTEITSDQASYQWFQYNSANGQWVKIVTDQGSQGENAEQEDQVVDTSYLKVTKDMASENSIFQCVMTYNINEPEGNRKEYKDYFSLKTFNHNYEAVAKFFNGSNTIDASEPFIVSYLELYKDQQPIGSEMLKSNVYCYDKNNRRNKDGTITLDTSSIRSEYKVEDRYMYFIYEDNPDAAVTSYTITAGVEPSGAGSVTGAGIYEVNTIPSIYAMAYSGYVFDHWKVNGVDTSITDNLYPGAPLTTNMSVVAVFAVNTREDDELPGFFVSITTSPSAGGTVSGGGWHEYGSSTTLVASANNGYIFADWYAKDEDAGTWSKLNWAPTTSLDVTKDWILMARFLSESQENIDYFNASIVAVDASGGDIVCLSKDEAGEDKIYKTQLTSEDAPFYYYAKAGTGRVITGARLEANLPKVSGLPISGQINQEYDAVTLRDSGLLIANDTIFRSYSDEITPSLYGYMMKWTIYFDSADNIKTYTISTQASPQRGGTVSDGGSFPNGTQITLIATPNDGYYFQYWVDEEDNTNPIRTITVDNRDFTYTAIFKEIPEDQYTITVVANPEEGGIVTGGGTYVVGTQVEIIAIKNDGYKFVRWTDGDLNYKRTITVKEDKTYTAVFTDAESDVLTAIISSDNASDTDRYYLSNNSDGTGSLGRSTEFNIDSGGTVYYYAQAGDGREIEYIGINSGSGVEYAYASQLESEGYLDTSHRTFTFGIPIISAMAGVTYEITIHFTESSSGGGSTSSTYTITTNASPSYGGTVSGSGTYNSGKTIELTATPADGYYLKGWLDDEGITSTTRYVTVYGNTTYTAIFAQTPMDQYLITTVASPLEGGTVTGGGYYTDGSTATLKAIPNTNYTFDYWSDNHFYPAERSVTVKEDKTYTANFSYNDGSSGGGTSYAEDTIVDGILYIGTNRTSIPEYYITYSSMSGITDVTHIVIPASVTSIGRYAFHSLNNSYSLEIPTSVTSIGALFITKSGVHIYYKGTEEQWNLIDIDDNNSQLPYATIHYNYTSTYSAEPMMMSAAPMTLSLDDDGIIAYTEEIASRPAKYKAALYQYKNGSWNPVSDNLQYRYKNDLYTNIESNVLVISKNDISNRKDINFTILPKVLKDNGEYVDDNDLIVARTSFAVFDLNDPIVSATEPLNPKIGQIWLDTSKSPYKLYIYQSNEWKYFDQQNGRRVYTHKQQLIDEGYTEGDLWILNKGETCSVARVDGSGYDTFKEGSMLRSTETRPANAFNESDWVDAMESYTTLKNNIDQTFTFSKQDGLTIGQMDQHFYVNINSQKMGFFDNSAGQRKEVVYISNNSANIDNMVVDGGAEFKCNVKLNEQLEFGVNNESLFSSKFVLQLEDNGSLSLVVAT